MKLSLSAPAVPVMPLLSTTATSPFTPAHYSNPEAGPIYHLRAPTFRLRLALERASLPIQMSIPSDAQMNDAAIAAAKALVNSDQLNGCLEILGNYGALLENPDRLQDKPDAALALADEARSLHQQLTQHWPALSQMVADRITALAGLRYLAARHYIAGWDRVIIDGQPFPFATGDDGLVADEALQVLPPQDIIAVALHIQSLSKQ